MSETFNFESQYYESEPKEEALLMDMSETALLLVDLQKQFVLSDFGDALEMKKLGEWEKWAPFHQRLDDLVIPNNQKLLNFFRTKNLEVTYGAIGCHHKDGRDRCLVQKKSGWNNILLPIGSYACEMVDELLPQEDEIVVYKTTDSVATGTNYCSLLRNMGIKNVIVTGIVTDQCVASTVRSLADEGFEIIVVEDACAAANMEVHNMELKIMNKIYCEIMTTDQTISYCEKMLQTNEKEVINE